MLKKGAIEVQFNWIYLSIVGGIILMVFISIGLNMRSSAKTSLESEIITYLDDLFVNLQSSQNTQHEIDLGGLELEFDSGEVCNFFRIKDSKLQGASTTYYPIFADQYITSKLLSYTRAWDVGITAGYFMYFTGPDHAYIILDQQLMDVLPGNMLTFPVEDIAEYTQKHDKVRIVTLEDPVALSPSHKEATAVFIQPDAELEAGGTITYYTLEGGSFSPQKPVTYYNNRETLLAAIYAKDALTYECNMAKSIARMNNIADVITAKVDAMDIPPRCPPDLYEGAKDQLKRLKIQEEFTKTDLEHINEAAVALDDINNQLSRKSCPLVL